MPGDVYRTRKAEQIKKLQFPDATATLVFAREPTVLEAVVNWERPSDNGF